MFKPTPKGFVPLGLVSPLQEVLHWCDLCYCFIFSVHLCIFHPQSPLIGRRGSCLDQCQGTERQKYGTGSGHSSVPCRQCPAGCHCGMGMSLCLEKQPALHHPSHSGEHSMENISIPLPSWLHAAYSSSLYFLYFNLPHLHIHRSKW